MDWKALVQYPSLAGELFLSVEQQLALCFPAGTQLSGRDEMRHGVAAVSVDAAEQCLDPRPESEGPSTLHGA